MVEPAPEFADVSVIVAAYQAAGTIGRALRSIAGQTLKPREVVVVDDGSSDGTFEAAESEAPNMNGIELRVFKTWENHGAGAARNRAIAESREPTLAFLDADDEWLPEKLERSTARLEAGDCQVQAGVIYLDVISNLQRIGDHLVNIEERSVKMVRVAGG